VSNQKRAQDSSRTCPRTRPARLTTESTPPPPTLNPQHVRRLTPPYPPYYPSPSDPELEIIPMARANVTEFNEGNFEQEVLQSDPSPVSSTSGPGCGPCRALAHDCPPSPTAFRGKAKVGQVEHRHQTARSHEFRDQRRFPTVIIFKKRPSPRSSSASSPRQTIKTGPRIGRLTGPVPHPNTPVRAAGPRPGLLVLRTRQHLRDMPETPLTLHGS